MFKKTVFLFFLALNTIALSHRPPGNNTLQNFLNRQKNQIVPHTTNPQQTVKRWCDGKLTVQEKKEIDFFWTGVIVLTKTGMKLVKAILPIRS